MPRLLDEARASAAAQNITGGGRNMSALKEWLDFLADLAHPPTREGFCAAWKQMSGRDAPVVAAQQFGRKVLPLFMSACDEARDLDQIPPSINAALAEAMKTGLVLGFKAADYGYDVEIEKLSALEGRAH